jgi:2-polyprenyl-3-methyl-5-hydroxy-6-metoxy-1,4-benzoquinol methylase
MQQTAQVQTYFTDRARLFDALYEEDGWARRSFNQIFRRPMFTRYMLTLGALRQVQGRRLLDVGCGAGRYAIELAGRGAQVTGIDFSDEMLTMAKVRASEAELEGSADFVSADFIDWASHTDARFDTAIAMGVLDYVEDAESFVAMMAQRADEVIISFPSPTPVRMPLRKLRYASRGCPVYFYRRARIEAIYRNAGLHQIDIRRLGFGGYWVHGRR